MASARGVPSGSIRSAARSPGDRRRAVLRVADVPNVLGPCTGKIDRLSPLERARHCKRALPEIVSGCAERNLYHMCARSVVFFPNARWCAHTSVNLTNTTLPHLNQDAYLTKPGQKGPLEEMSQYGGERPSGWNSNTYPVALTRGHAQVTSGAVAGVMKL